MNKIIQTIVIFLLALLFACSSVTSEQVAGTGSQAGNGIIIASVVTSTDSTPISDASVVIRSSDYLARDSKEFIEKSTFTNASGAFEFDDLPEGEYVIEVMDKDSMTIMHKLHVKGDSVHTLGHLAPRKPSGFHGVVDMTNVPGGIDVYVQVYGLNIEASVNSMGEFFVPHIPSGEHIIHIMATIPSYGIIDADTITVNPGEDLNTGHYMLPFDFWRDTVVIRELLDQNGLTEIPTDEVTKKDPEGRIVELILDNRNISIIPSKIRELRLHKLALINNTGLTELPNEIGAILSLKALVLRNSGLTLVPASIGDIRHLRELDISDNKLTDLPQNYINLRELKLLMVNNNQLTSQTPEITNWINKYSTDRNWAGQQ